MLDRSWLHKNKVESARLIEKDGVLGFQRTATEFEPVTNFTARVDGYVADEGDIIGYILDLKLNQGDPLDPNASKTKMNFSKDFIYCFPHFVCK